MKSNNKLPLQQSPASVQTTTAKQGENPIRIRSKRSPHGNLLINLPIGTRLTLGFIAAALIAAIVAGAIGVQHAQALSSQNSFYQNLLQANTGLNTGAQYLELMTTETQAITTTENTQIPSQETLQTDTGAVKNLSSRYDSLLTTFAQTEALNKHTDEINLLKEGNHENQVQQQQTLISSTSRTWHLYQSAVQQFLQEIQKGQIATATALEKAQLEPTNSDAQSALRSLIQFNVRLSNSVSDATNVEQKNQIISTILWSIVAFILIILIGWFISGTIIRRLQMLRQVTMAVEQGQLNQRVSVIGRDEIADVSGSVNAMLDAIITLVDETRHQRDALTNAAEHLFSDMRIVSAGDLRINAPVSNDPIGMLANAFNFTVGRFRRFVQRTKAIAEQLDAIAHREVEHSEAFSQALINSHLMTQSNSEIATIPSAREPCRRFSGELANDRLETQIQQIKDYLQQVSNTGFKQYYQTIRTTHEKIIASCERISRLPLYNGSGTTNTIRNEEIRIKYTQERQTLENALSALISETQHFHQQTDNTFQTVDKDLGQLTLAARSARAGDYVDTATQIGTARITREAVTEVARLSSSYVNDINTLAHQLSAIARELRTSIISFQFDALENSEVNPLDYKVGNSQPGTIGTFRIAGEINPHSGNTMPPRRNAFASNPELRP
ncbi:MAG TPA: HAMP domain-containing protein [Dictyobacter sp.]|nr:HAMP domain-containing protein [Dictyobacter sp.]